MRLNRPVVLRDRATDSVTLKEKFKKNFRETCTVGIDRLELLGRKEWKDQTPLIVDRRKWG